MDTSDTHSTLENPHESAGFISRVFCIWLMPLFRKGIGRNLTLEDCFVPLTSHKAELLGDKLQKAWNEEMVKLKSVEYTEEKNGKREYKGSRPSLHRVFIKTFWKEYFFIGLRMFFQSVILRSLQPVIQSRIISHFTDSNMQNLTTESMAFSYSALLTINTLLIALFARHNVAQGNSVAMTMRIAASSLVYRKILRLSKASLNKTTPGQITNILSNDVGKFDGISAMGNFIWILPVQLAVMVIIMWPSLGLILLVGIVTLLVLVLPVQFVINYFSKIYRGKIATKCDIRIQLMNELVNGIQVVKMYAWEKSFLKKVYESRASEMNYIRSSTFLRTIFFSLMAIADKISIYTTLIPFVLMGNQLTPEITFTLVTFFSILQSGPAFYLPVTLIRLGELSISIQRIQVFLMLDETCAAKSEDELIDSTKQIVPRADDTMPKQTKNKKIIPVNVDVHHVSANWVSGQPTLSDLTFSIRGGELCALVGPVGSGKSSILNLLLQELQINSGTVNLFEQNDGGEIDSECLNKQMGYRSNIKNLRISYCSQDPWLFPGTIRQNILFGQEFDESKYQDVLKVCALAIDIENWSDGDRTMVGENGVILSGGQKARVNLARTVYREADLYLFDDPLSAVDARVARHLFRECIDKYLNGRTRILVTHQLQFLRRTDTIVLIEKGFLIRQGSYEEFKKNDSQFLQSLKYMGQGAGSSGERKISESGRTFELGKFNSVDDESLRGSMLSLDIISDEAIVFSQSGKIMSNETVESRTTGLDVWLYYFRAGGNICVLMVVLILCFAAQIGTSIFDYWLSYWTSLEEFRNYLIEGNTDNYRQLGSKIFSNESLFIEIFEVDEFGLISKPSTIYIYTGIMILNLILYIFRTFALMMVCMRASQTIHNRMFNSLLNATLKFFNTNISGRILNRISKDVGVMDDQLPITILESLRLIFRIISAFVLIILVNHLMIIPTFILGVFLLFITKLFLKTAQTIKRLESACKSPVFSHVKSTLIGLTTIRSCDHHLVEVLSKQFDKLQDTHTGMWFLTIMGQCLLGIYVDILTTLFIGALCFSFIVIHPEKTLGANVGLAISQALLLVGTVQYALRLGTEMLYQMTAVERVKEYTNLPQEKLLGHECFLPLKWPGKGEIIFRNLNLRYDPDQKPVLKDLNLTIESGWKVGIVGRTGAGKSSIIATLFRLENEGIEGDIEIDGINTGMVNLERLRSNISIIPQSPILFGGSVRFNLDPFDDYSDSDLYGALRDVELSNFRLDDVVNEDGSNFSVGQRQLICLARAILKNNHILVLDEATANIDGRTDSLIQKTLRTNFKNQTVITVAHRLRTVIDSDRILVMSDGRIMEFGCPYQLLRDNPDGHLANMIKQIGKTSINELWKMAEKACFENPKHDCRKMYNPNSIDS